MSRYSIVNTITNAIRVIECHPDWITLQLQENEVAYAGHYPSEFFTHDNGLFIEKDATALTHTVDTKSATQLSMLIYKHLRNAGFDLIIHDEHMQTKANAKRLIDQAAGRVRVRWTSPGQLIEEEYNQAKRQSKTYLEDISQTVQPMVKSWAEASNRTYLEAAQHITDTATSWELILDVVYDLRMKGKAAVDTASEEEFKAVAQNYIEQLDAL